MSITSSSSAPEISYDFAQLDVFAERPLEGNALAVFTDARGLSTGQMQSLAREDQSQRDHLHPPPRPRPRTRTWRSGAHLHRCRKNSSSPVTPHSAPQAGSTGTTPRSKVQRRSSSISA